MRLWSIEGSQIFRKSGLIKVAMAKIHNSISSTGNKGVKQLNLNLFRKCGVLPPLLLLMLGLLLATGCLRLEASQGGIAPSAEEASPPHLQLDFASRVSCVALCAEGNVVLWGNETLPYLLLNASFYNDGRPEKSTKYMMMEVDPNKEQPFKICKNARAPPGNYTCVLEAWGPDGKLGSETRECEVARDSFAPKESAAEKAYGNLPPSQREAGPAAQEDNPFVFLPEPQPEEKQPAKGSELDKIAQSSERISSKDMKQEDTVDAIEPTETTNGSRESLDAVAKEKTGLVGSSGSKKYHLPECRYAANIRPENRIYFADEKDARKQGYQPCRVCFP
jgi:hypothetical protein